MPKKIEATMNVGYLMIRSRLKASVSAEVVRFTLKLFKQSGHVGVGKAVSRPGVLI